MERLVCRHRDVRVTVRFWRGGDRAGQARREHRLTRNDALQMPPIPDVVLLVAAVPAAAAGGAMFLRGVVGVAAGLRVPPLLVATTIAAFATSAPELSVSGLAAWAGRPGIGLGDALGSNVVNLGLVLGSALLFGPMTVRFPDIRHSVALAFAVPVLTLALGIDGTLSRVDGAVLLSVFMAWTAWMVRAAQSHRRQAWTDAARAASPVPVGAALANLIAGLAALLVAGRLFVVGASGIAAAFGVHPYVIGATVVSAGTSLPEWVTVMLARRRAQDDVGVGTLIGSNLFNGLGVVGMAASIRPIRASLPEMGLAVAFGLLTLALTVPVGDVLGHRRGAALLLAYAAFIAATAALAA